LSLVVVAVGTLVAVAVVAVLVDSYSLQFWSNRGRLYRLSGGLVEVREQAVQGMVEMVEILLLVMSLLLVGVLATLRTGVLEQVDHILLPAQVVGLVLRVRETMGAMDHQTQLLQMIEKLAAAVVRVRQVKMVLGQKQGTVEQVSILAPILALPMGWVDGLLAVVGVVRELTAVQRQREVSAVKVAVEMEI
jgi:hypothetical protein